MISKKIATVTGAVFFVLVTLISYSLFSAPKGMSFFSSVSFKSPLGSQSQSGQTTISQTTVNDEPKTEECPLNGQLMTKTQKDKWVTRRPLGIMIENHTDARPQSGLSSADVVYETVAEGGITRFLAVFYCQDASFVGPVRSARMYFIKLLEGYGQYPLYAHVGGANTPGPADALGYISGLGWGSYNDLNQFAVPFPNYWRDPERLPNRATEHTVYTATSKLWDYSKTKRKLTNVDEEGVSWDKAFTKWIFKNDNDLAKRGTTNKISFSFWSSFEKDYTVTWNYDKTTNFYARENGGVPHIDKNTGKPIRVKDVVVVFADESPANDGYEGGHILYDLTGTGKTLVFQDGNAIIGTWKKADEESSMVFYDENGKEIMLVRGQVFVEILPIGNTVSY